MFASLRSTIVEHGSSFDAGSLTGAEAVETLDDLCVMQRVVDAMVAQTMKRIADTNAHAGTSARDAATLIANRIQVPVGRVRDTIDIADRLAELPRTAEAARTGQLSGPATKLIAETTAVNPDAERHLLEVAREGLHPLSKTCAEVIKNSESPADRKRRQEKSQYWRSWHTPDGMVKGSFQFTPEFGGQIETLIEGLRQKLFSEHRAGKHHEAQDYYAAQAALSLLLGNANAGVNFTVNILIDHEALKRGDVLEGETCEIEGVGPVSVEWVRSILGEAFLKAVIKKGVDVTTVAHLGRHVKAEVMTALLVGGHECDIEGCEIHGYLERDHVHELGQGGVTSLANLHWLCYYHHQLKTRGWILGPPNPATGKRKLSLSQSQAA